MRINFFSDIHLEFGDLDPPDTDADVIIAAGDIGVATQGADWLKSLKKPVIYVAGNHEFYNRDYRTVLLELRELCKGSNVHFLENNRHVLQGVRFLGCTLWTDLFAEGDEKAQEIGHSLNDFRRVKYDGEAFGVNHFTGLHQKSRKWLEKELAKPFSGKTIVVTHHAPSQWSWNEAPGVLKKLAYCNDLKPLLHEYEVAAWFHGHIHSPGDYRIADARILCNPRGYAGKKLVAGFDQNKIVVI